MTVKEIERIGSPEIARHDARKAYIEYRRALQRDPAGKQAKDYAALMRGYRAIAAGQQVLDLHKVMNAAGVQPETNLPKLAIGRADWEWTWCRRNSAGAAIFSNREVWDVSERRAAGAVRLPQATFLESRQSFAGKALTPMIPPSGQPSTDLSNFYILWDAVWIKQPPADPLLLKHLGGALYAILFAWDLTPLEQAVLRGRL